MALSRKNFEAVAQIIRQTRIPGAAAGFDDGWDSALAEVSVDLADYFATENPNFDRARFMAACEAP